MNEMIKQKKLSHMETYIPPGLEDRQQFRMWKNPKQCERLLKRWGSYETFLDKEKKKPVFAALSELMKHFKFLKPTVLEVGCGCGHWLWQLHKMGISVIGQDYSEAMQLLTMEEFAKRNVTIDVYGGSCWDLPLVDDAVDISFQIDVCMHVGGSWESIREMLRVSQKAVFFTGPSFEEWKEKFDRKIGSKSSEPSWGISRPLLEEKLIKLKQKGGITNFYYRNRPPTDTYKHRILIIEK